MENHAQAALKQVMHSLRFLPVMKVCTFRARVRVSSTSRARVRWDHHQCSFRCHLCNDMPPHLVPIPIHPPAGHAPHLPSPRRVRTRVQLRLPCECVRSLRGFLWLEQSVCQDARTSSVYTASPEY